MKMGREVLIIGMRKYRGFPSSYLLPLLLEILGAVKNFP